MLVLVPLLTGQAWAERLTSAISDVTTISDVRGGSRVLFHWAPEFGRDVAVRKATLRFVPSGEPVARSLTVRVFPVTAPWAGPGDVSFDADVWSYGHLNLAEPGPVILDVTTVVKDLVEGGRDGHGFVIAADGAAEEGLTQADLARLSGLSSATIDVVWRKTSGAPVR
jgi:hypothetical protein